MPPVPDDVRPSLPVIARDPSARARQLPLVVLVAWGLAHVAARLLVSPALELDEAEQAIWTQSAAWGYGSQPPLYTWLQIGFFKLLGPGVLALSSLKFLLLGSTFFLMWRAGRELVSERAALWASASLLLIPAIGWESLRDLTHSVLLTCVVAATWLALLCQIRRPDPRKLAALGVLVGLGMLSKYSYALFILPLGLAALSLPGPRAALLARGWWLLPCCAGLIVLPHALWLLDHWQAASQGSVGKLRVGAGNAPLVLGLLQVLEAVLSNLLLWLVVVGAAYRGLGGRRRDGHPQAAVPGAGQAAAPPWARPLLQRYLLLLAACLLLMALAGVTHFKSRWLYPALICVPWAVFLRWPPAGPDFRGRYLAVVLSAVAVLGLALLVLRPWFNARGERPGDLNAPVLALKARLLAAGYDGRSPIVASDQVLGGNLRVRFPHAPVVVCADPAFDCGAPRSRTEGYGLLRVARRQRPSAAWWGLARAGGQRGPAPLQVELPYRWSQPEVPPVIYHFSWQPPRP